MAIASDYAGLWVWLKGDTGFVDQSGNSRTITLPGGGNNPTIAAGVANSHAAFKFVAASQQWFGLPSMAALTAGEMYLVIQKAVDPPPANPAAGVYNLGGSSSDSHIPWDDGVIYDAFGSTVRQTVGNPTPSLALPSYYNPRSSPGNWTAELNGTQIFTTATNTVAFPASPTIGRDMSGIPWLDGLIAEVFIYSQIRSAAERAALIATLQATYGSSLWGGPSAARLTAAAASVAARDVATPVPKVRLSGMSASVVALDIGNPPQTGARITAMSASVAAVDVANPPRSAPYSYAMVIS